MECDDNPLIVDSTETDGQERRPKDTLLSLLDEVEEHVERLRRVTLILEERKDIIFTTLDAIKNSELLTDLHDTDRDDIHKYVERLSSRCTTVEILVRTDRNKQQEEALHEINSYIDNLVISFKSNPINSLSKCQSFLAACSSQPEVPSDKAFESALLGCTLDDQKKIKKRLQGLYTYIDQTDSIAEEIQD